MGPDDNLKASVTKLLRFIVCNPKKSITVVALEPTTQSNEFAQQTITSNARTAATPDCTVPPLSSVSWKKFPFRLYPKDPKAH
jgi:hypothetical protein